VPIDLAGARRPLAAWVRGVNALLPRTLAVIWAREVGGQEDEAAA